MSGLDALAALGIACNIMQIISFAHETVSICKAIFQTRSPDPSLTNNVRHLTKLFEELEGSLSSTPKPLNKDEQELLDIAKESLAATSDLKTEVEKITSDVSNGKYTSAISGGLKATFKKRRIEKLEKSMLACQRTLESRILLRICNKNDAILLQQQGDFGKLDATLRNFIGAFSRGQTHLAQLLGKESESIKQHIIAETSQSQEAITSHVTSESSKTREELSIRLKEMACDRVSTAQHEKILQSLKYETMNERRNQISESHPRTCEWIFGAGPAPVSDTDRFSVASTAWGSQSGNDSEILYVEDYSHSQLGKPWDSFSDWLQSPGKRLYWISGKAGSGKSTLMKFLIKDPRTQSGLDSSNPNTAILSHFLWTAGQPMQRNRKGIFCSLINQLLLDDVELSALILQRFPSIGSKDFHGDWSDQELEAVTFHAFDISSRAICIFLDGLDEICPSDGKFRLLELIDKFYALPRLKICVSSRPEPELQRHLSNFPMLQVQDLTRPDIQRYSTELLRPYFRISDKEFSDFIRAVCEKADGVFLWVSLALKSLRKGLSNEDDWSELRQRLDSLPSDIHELYQNMWRRLNEDVEIYREDAAMYFNLVLDSPLVAQREGFSLFQLMLASNPPVADTILKDYTVLSPEEFAKACQKTSKHMETRCAGLLEVSPKTDKITFIHRSANEFLENTPEGQRILQNDKLTPEARLFNLFRAELALLRLRTCPSSYLYSRERVSRERVESPRDLVEKILNCEILSATKALELMQLCEELYKTGEWFYGCDPMDFHLQPDFNGIAAIEGAVEFVSSALQSLRVNAPGGTLSDSYKRYLLSAAFSRYKRYHFTKDSKLQTIALLLEERIDPNIRSIDIDHIPNANANNFNLFHTKHLLNRTPIMALLESTIGSLPVAVDSPTLLSFMKQLFKWGAHLSDSTILVLERFKDKFALRMNWARHIWIHGRGTVHDGIIIVEADVSFLVRVYLKTMAESAKALPAAQDLFAGIEEASVSGSATILAFLLDETCLLDQGRTKFYMPATGNDSSYVLSSLDGINLPNRNNYYEIPGLWDRLKEIAERAQETTLQDVEADLVKKGHLVRVEDVKDWPPKPFAP